MARIQRKDVDRIANLARLHLSDEEAGAMQRDLEEILDYVAAWQDLDTEGVEPTEWARSQDTPLRADRADEPMNPQQAIANAPESSGTAFRVPKVIDEEGS